MVKKIPILYIFLYSKLRKDSRTEHILKSKIYDVLNRTIIKRVGFSKHLIKYVIKDLEYYELLEKINRQTYRIIDNDCEKYLKRIFLY